VNEVLTTGKTIRGIVEGDGVPDLVIPSLVQLYMQGRFPFDALSERRSPHAADAQPSRTERRTMRLLSSNR
jgi:aryl-alcohol dehydrogenase